LGCRPPVITWRLYCLPLFLGGGFALFNERGSFKKKEKLKKESKSPDFVYILLYKSIL
jgi:hypothetical protein